MGARAVEKEGRSQLLGGHARVANRIGHQNCLHRSLRCGPGLPPPALHIGQTLLSIRRPRGMSAVARSQVPRYGMRRHCCELSGTAADCAGVKRRLPRRQVSRVPATQESGFFILGGRRPRWPQRRASANYVGLMQILAAGRKSVWRVSGSGSSCTRHGTIFPIHSTQASST